MRRETCTEFYISPLLDTRPLPSWYMWSGPVLLKLWSSSSGTKKLVRNAESQDPVHSLSTESEYLF